MYADLALYIDGRFITVSPGRPSQPVLEPATGEVLGDLPHASDNELDQAVEAAVRAFRPWRAKTPYERSAILRRAASLLRERFEHIARVLTREQGKPLAESKAELVHAIDLFDWFAEEGRRAYGRVIPSRATDIQQFTLMEPVGPAAVFTPWNFPALTPARKLAAGLAAGCPVILKAAEETPGTAVAIVRALHDAGLPAGCVALVFGNPSEVSTRLLARREIRKISFTGSTEVGKHLLKLAANTVKRTTLELGGNAPVIVYDDADYERALAYLTAGKFRNAGQVCIAPARFFVHEKLYARFTADLATRARSLVVDNGLNPDSQMGPLANQRRLDAMERVVADAELHGGRVLCGGGRCGDTGFFFEPTVVADLDETALLFTEETFGPVMPVARFESSEEVFARANRVEAGLAGYVFTTSIAHARSAMQELEVGMLGINTLSISTPETPFGGVKQSGYGAEGGIEGLQAFLETRFVAQA